MEKHAISRLAGIEAQRKSLPMSVRSYHGQTDYTNCIDVLEDFATSPEEVEAWIRLLSIRARNLVANDWTQISAIAEALMKRKQLSAREVQRIFTETIV